MLFHHITVLKEEATEGLHIKRTVFMWTVL